MFSTNEKPAPTVKPRMPAQETDPVGAEQVNQDAGLDRFLDHRPHKARIALEIDHQPLDQEPVDPATDNGAETSRKEHPHHEVGAKQSMAVEAEQYNDQYDDRQQCNDGLEYDVVRHLTRYHAR
jgi:hypothetical protein